MTEYNKEKPSASELPKKKSVFRMLIPFLITFGVQFVPESLSQNIWFHSTLASLATLAVFMFFVFIHTAMEAGKEAQ